MHGEERLVRFHTSFYMFKHSLRLECALIQLRAPKRSMIVCFSVSRTLPLCLQPGFYDLSMGCLPCDCNLGGSESAVCDQSSPVAQCPCRPNIDSTTCTSPLPGYYFRPLDYILFEAEGATLTEVWTQQHRVCTALVLIKE